MFCFFVLFSAGIWYVHSLQKQRDILPHNTAEQEAKPEPVFAEKQFRLDVKSRGVPEGKSLLLFPSEVELTAQVDVEHYNEVHADDFQVICTYPQEPADALAIEGSCSSPYVSTFKLEPQTAEYIIEVQKK